MSLYNQTMFKNNMRRHGKKVHTRCGIEYVKTLWQSMNLFELAVLWGYSVPLKSNHIANNLMPKTFN